MKRKIISLILITALTAGISFGFRSDEGLVVTGRDYYISSNRDALVLDNVEISSLTADDILTGSDRGDAMLESGNDDLILGEDDLMDRPDDVLAGAGDEDADILAEEDIVNVVPDEPDNVVDTEEDNYYEIEQEYVYDDRPFDASYITGEGVNRIRKVIVAYAESLGGTFMSPYYKGGQAVSIQCCAYVNQVWKHVFGKDIYDQGVMTTTSHEGETIYNFLDRTGARAGDILYVRYWKIKKNDWSSHFMILLDYDRTGVYVTDGYETDEGKFVVWRIDKKALYSKSNFFKKTGSDKEKPHSKHWSGKDGSFFKLYRMRQEEWCNVANSDYNEYATDPMVRSVFIRTNRLEGTYTISAIVYSSNGLDRVQFPVWTVADGQDDLLPYYETDEAASGEIEGIDDDMYQVTYTVNIADHNQECGNYMGEMYMYDNEGVLITHSLDAVNMDGASGSICVDHIPWSLE
ncbi:MAG: GBS Bsp-like repeat-containing protein [Lachnospiraceae bacterium]|nr:GBS Bsp-like repeat-containing protein [Lachnospiraceae bacterium]